MKITEDRVQALAEAFLAEHAPLQIHGNKSALEQLVTLCLEGTLDTNPCTLEFFFQESALINQSGYRAFRPDSTIELAEFALAVSAATNREFKRRLGGYTSEVVENPANRDLCCSPYIHLADACDPPLSQRQGYPGYVSEKAA